MIANITAGSDIDRLIAAASGLGLDHRVALLRSVRAGELQVIEPSRDGIVPLRMLDEPPRPTIVLLGDDDYCSTGPDGWPTWRRVLRWAAGALIHASGADVPSYQCAIGMALQCRRFLLIETSTARAETWSMPLLARRVPHVCLMPRDGVHPVMPTRETMQ